MTARVADMSTFLSCSRTVHNGWLHVVESREPQSLFAGIGTSFPRWSLIDMLMTMLNVHILVEIRSWASQASQPGDKKMSVPCISTGLSTGGADGIP